MINRVNDDNTSGSDKDRNFQSESIQNSVRLIAANHFAPFSCMPSAMRLSLAAVFAVIGICLAQVRYYEGFVNTQILDACDGVHSTSCAREFATYAKRPTRVSWWLPSHTNQLTVTLVETSI